MKILLAEDDPNISKIAKLVLEKVGGHEVDLVENGNDALDFAIKTKYDLIVLDGMMPGLSGAEVCRSYKQNTPQNPTPVVFLSAKSSPQDIAEFLSLGAGYIQKPFNPQSLCNQLDEILKGAA